MTMLAEKKEERILSLADYEARIRLYKEQAVAGYIGIGRTLSEAKAAGVVPHGEWEKWVTEQTGLSIRQAQRCMQAAAEISEGSWLGRIDMSKAMLLLGSGLEDGEKEELGRRAAEEGATVRELREEIARIRGERDKEDAENRESIRALKKQIVQETGAAAEIRAALKRAEEERGRLEQQLRATAAGFQERLDEECGKAYRRGMQDSGEGAREDARKEFQGKIDFINGERKKLEETADMLREKLAKERKDAGARWDEGYSAAQDETRQKLNDAKNQVDDLLEEREKLRQQIREMEEGGEPPEVTGLRNELNKQNQYVAGLMEDLKAAEAREANRAKELAELRKERTAAKMDAARGIRADVLDGLDLTAAVRSFIGSAGVLPQLAGVMAGMSESERAGIRAQVETVGEWVRASLAALDAIPADGCAQ